MKKNLISIIITLIFIFNILTISAEDIKNNPKEKTINQEISYYLPDYFNWLDYNGQDWTTPAKDQGNCGSCWNFAANGALESIIKIREGSAKLDIDLSEQYVLSCLPRSGTCAGGYAYSAFKFIHRNDSRGNYCNGTIPEFCFPYEARDDISCESKISNWIDFLIPISDYGKWSPSGSVDDINKIKAQIMENGPVVTTMMATYNIHGDNNLEDWGWENNDPNKYYPYPGPYTNTNHQVVLVGWKDDSTIGNGGYWIVKNSFSSEWGYNGFFNIEYGSLNIDNRDINWVDYDENSVDNWMPKSDAGGIYFGDINHEIIFNGSNSYDHEGEIISFTWNFGDGSIENGKILTHNYENPGIYEISLKIEDNHGNIDNDTTWVFIDRINSAPEKPNINGINNGRNGTEYEYIFSAIDPEGDDIYYYINWGDTFWEGRWDNWIGPYKSGEEIKLKNIFYEKGNYTIRVKVKDKYGYKSDWTILKTSMSNKIKNDVESLIKNRDIDFIFYFIKYLKNILL